MKLFEKIEKNGRVKFYFCGLRIWKQKLPPCYYKKSYAHEGEDVLLDNFYDSMRNYNGFYIDIGALHPE